MGEISPFSWGFRQYKYKYKYKKSTRQKYKDIKKGSVAKRKFCSTPLFALWVIFLLCLRVKEWFWVYLGHGKADREDSHGLAVEFFLSFICYAAFFSE